MNTPLNVVFDMETHDPDDFLTLLLLLGHPQVNLKAVTITPGSPFQVALVRRALSWFDADIPVGAHNLQRYKGCVSSWHYHAYGLTGPSLDARPGGEVLFEACDLDTTLVTGAPLKNLGAAMAIPGFELGRWVAQGGFAGEGVIPRERQLAKFKGMTTCPTFNLNGDPRAAIRALKHPGIKARRFVSKNVCHGVVYDQQMHLEIAKLKGRSHSLRLIWQGMETYLSRKRKRRWTSPRDSGLDDNDTVMLIDADGNNQGHTTLLLAEAAATEAGMGLRRLKQRGQVPVCRIGNPQTVEGKKLHDPLAACCAIDPQIGQWAEVDLYRDQRGHWGSRPSPGSDTWIITDYDHPRFMDVLTRSAR